MTARAPLDNSSDPRTDLADESLVAAQTNHFPLVASQFARRDRAGLMFGASIALLLGSATLFAMSSGRHNAQNRPSPEPMQSPASDLMTPGPAMIQPAPAAQPVPIAPALAAVSLPLTAPSPMFAPRTGAATERLRAPAVVFDNGAAAEPGAAPMAQAASPVAASAKASPSRDDLSPEELFAQRVRGRADTATPDRMTSPSTTVSQGTLMTAVLETAINSDLQGYVRAVISQDVKSFDGRNVLIPRGSHLIGEYKSGLAVGQSRAYILWTRLLRPDGVSIALASPATDYSGQNGLGGKVDNHFVKRFGAAILLSVIGAAGQAVGGGTGTVILTGPQQAVSAGAQRDINIPPTVKVGLGQPIRVFTARDLDFSSVSAAP
ncbi:MAG: TrbI/VirB10 family protein [Novosphingobium sp.]